MEQHEKFSGTCAAGVEFDLVDGRLTNVRFRGGCSGNLQAISVLCEGMTPDEIIPKLKGIRCGARSTSCGDQFAKALERALQTI